MTSAPGPGAGEITLSWDAVTGASRYEVQQKKVKTLRPDEWKPLPFNDFTVTIAGAEAVVGGLENDKSYHHRVRGVNANSVSEWAELTTDLPEALKPGGLSGSVKPSSIGEITLKWNAVRGTDHYEVQQKVRDYWFDWFDDWETLPFGNTTVRFTDNLALVGPRAIVGNPAGGKLAVVGNLKYGEDDTTYEHRVRSVNAAGPSNWSDSVKTTLDALVARGHQRDHTVRYLVAPMSATPEPGLPNPATIIPSAVPTAVSAWNAMIAAHGLVICKGGTGSCDERNTDGTITVRLVTSSDACRSSACVQPPVGGISNHRGDEEMILEERPIDSKDPRVPNRHYRWTDVPSLNNTFVSLPSQVRQVRWKYVGAVLIHEFGHPLGLPDRIVPAPSVMTDPDNVMNVTQNDVDYLRKIYSGHVRGE